MCLFKSDIFNKLFSLFYNSFRLIYIELIKYIMQYIFEILDLNLKFEKKIEILNNMIEYIDSDFARSKNKLKINQKLDFYSYKNYN